MKRVSKDQKQQRADLVTRLNDAAEAVRAALVAVNAEIAGKLNSAIENYNLILSVAEAFRDEIVSELEHYASDRSDRWQKSERGERHEARKQEWEGLDVTALDAIDAIDELREVAEQHGDVAVRAMPRQGAHGHRTNRARDEERQGPDEQSPERPRPVVEEGWPDDRRVERHAARIGGRT